ncbi:polysaccharide deacetylase family protein [Halobacillus sp. A5]|uniref:polysaccharide deacetylase family protein n=1 Tax=Halobacillus sp. A5 TaxID=2880263 RepID=UPI0020A6BC11|nr:polysaccharide deacetylase family protein [Halobacillus sp. A5]MCP3026263.1 polysaccharide deacetylase family protein [Halobacillus sp. A5]
MGRILSLLLALVILASCSDGQAQKSNANQEDEGNTTEENEETDEENNNEESTDQKKEEEESDEVEEDQEPEPRYIMNEAWSFEPIDDAAKDVVLLTFDDAPDKYGLEIAQTLHKLNAPAIFFVNGHFIDTEEKRKVLKEIHELGFPIGNHTMTHASLQEISEEEQEAEILDLNDEIEEITGERPKFFRAPFGQNTELTEQIAEDEEMLLMNWTYGYDWEADYQDADSLADIMVNTELLVPGANLLMHDREWTAEAVPEIVDGFKEKGYELLDPDYIQIEE